MKIKHLMISSGDDDELFKFGTHFFDYNFINVGSCIGRPYFAQNIYVCDFLYDGSPYYNGNLPLAILFSDII